MKQFRSLITLALIIASSALLIKTEALAQDRRNQPAALPPDSNQVIAAKSSTRVVDEFDKLKSVVADQQKRIDRLERMLAQQTTLIEQALHV